MADTAGPDLADFKPDAWRGAPGRHRVGQTRDGAWWWVPPDGPPAFVCGVQAVRRTPATAGGHALLAQLRAWGFNLLGSGTAVEFTGHGLPHLESLELRRADAAAAIRTGDANLPDVFDPDWSARCAARVAAVNAGAGLVGYLGDVELGWAQPPPDVAPRRPTLLQLCLALDPRHAAYHAAWEFVLAPRGGELPALAEAWDLALPNKETLRQLTRDEIPLATPGYLADLTRFTREVAQRYFRGVAAAVHEADPGRLVFSAPVPAALPAEIREAAAAHADVVLTDAPPDHPGGGPVLLVDFAWNNPPDDPARDEPPGLSRLERMHRLGRAALTAAAAHPGVIGYTWAAYAEGDRLADAPFARGLVYDDGLVAHEHVQPLAAFHGVAARLHAMPLRE